MILQGLCQDLPLLKETGARPEASAELQLGLGKGSSNQTVRERQLSRMQKMKAVLAKLTFFLNILNFTIVHKQILVKESYNKEI